LFFECVLINKDLSQKLLITIIRQKKEIMFNAQKKSGTRLTG